MYKPKSLKITLKEFWSGLPCPPPGDLPDPGIELMSLMSPALAYIERERLRERFWRPSVPKC